MKKLFLFLLVLPFFSTAQNTFKAVIKNSDTKEPIPGATVVIKSVKAAATTNDSGFVLINNISNGKQSIQITSVGYKEVERSITFPLTIDTILIFLEPSAEEMDVITVASTRSNRSINNTPTRVEVIGEEEVHEEATMRPGDIRMLLAESTGIQTQQTSATTANAGIRIQGLDGRYTQILKDGFPIYAGAASGLGLLQTPPLDLRQVEIIKGSSSTLYGGGAIAGLINLITKVPTQKRQLNIDLNVTSAGGLDVNTFYAQRFGKIGLTLYAARNSNKAYDPAGISFSAIPKFERYTLNPKLFLYFTDKTKASFGLNTMVEDRLGGDMKYIKGKGDGTHSFFERNKTGRLSTQLTIDHQVNDKSSIKIKNSIGYFNRSITSGSYGFKGTQINSFTEATYVSKREESDWVAGLNLLTDGFKEPAGAQQPLRNYNSATAGAFVQNTWNVLDWLTLETGLRADIVKDYGVAVLPRVSALFQLAPGLTSRIGGGLGYKPPTIFTEETERLLYKDVLPISTTSNGLERSYGANGDINYKTTFDEFTFSINQFFFYTVVTNPLFLTQAPAQKYRLQNIAGHTTSKGGETNVKLAYDELALYLGYTYTDAQVHQNGTATQNPLTPKHRFNAALVYELEGKWKAGSELYYFSKQKLSDGNTGRGYWLYGFVAERLFKKFSLFINFENIGDVRQTKFENIYTGTISNPVFKDIYAPLEGFVVNGGIKIKL